MVWKIQHCVCEAQTKKELHLSQLTFTCSKLTIETLEKGVE